MSGLDWLRCPHCALPLARTDQTLRCQAGHSFDIARQGYVNLLGRAAPRNADTPSMLEARARFLGAGHYAPLAEAVAAQVSGAARIAEVGAGTGYYLSRALDANPSAEGLATDVSAAAARRAAKAHPRASSIVADTWAGLPLRDGAVDTLLCVFAPRNPAEFTRVLAPGGRLVVAVPTPAHLGEVRAEYGLLGVADDKADAVLASLPGWSLEALDTLVQPLHLAPEEVADLIAMGPNAFHGRHGVTVAASTTLAVSILTLTHPS
ncbi:methyltransferase domain-containing protein [Tessaracoccus sp. MC1679]|uniref:putative RNA methyltransferase n=1 Tax=Tessaracoccus sp. MC1679 TaxID=2760313 RepID=UPI001600D213|nr:methyltransferase domain-containing protein [Tessaracoccus sp. MC1679]